jgi:cytochrome c biogenesis protein CcdA
MSTWGTVALVYFTAGLTCWMVLAIAYVRIGRHTSSLNSAATKVAIALPVIVFWPLFVLALLRSERLERHSRAQQMKQDEPTQARPDRVEGR